MEHISVLLNESIDMLQVKDDGIYVDCTLGRGGHSSEILKRCTKGHLYALDCDQIAIDQSTTRLAKVGKNFTCIHTPYEKLNEVLDAQGIGQVDGILMDLGVSSPQFDDGQRGFSYRSNARLDMRMDQSQDLDAWTVVNTYSLQDLTRILKQYGQEPFAYKIAASIVSERENKSIDTTFELVDLIKLVLPQKVLNKKGHPAKRSFQAIRMEVNGELDQLQIALEAGIHRLKPGGRLCVITFHSLEDRIVKNAFKAVATPKKVDRRLPEIGIESLEYQLINKKPIVANESELATNKRAHSAKLRGIERKRGSANEEEKDKEKRALNSRKILVIVCIFAGFVYCSTKIGLNAYNIALATEDQALSEKVSKQEKKVEQLTSDINTLQDKTRVLGILDDDVADNQKNVYIIE